MKPMVEDLPYPELDGLTKDRKNALVVMPAYADAESELTAILQYIYHSHYFEESGNDEYALALEEIAVAEMKHLDLLGKALLKMGVSPIYSKRPPEKCDFFSTCCVDRSTQPTAMLAADISAETDAIRSYEQMLCELTEPTLAALISRILLDERLHLKKFKEMYRELISNIYKS